MLIVAWGHGEDSRPHWLAAPTYWQAQNIMRAFAHMARSAGVLKTITMTPPLKAELINGARIEGRSWDRPENMYGPSVLSAVIDEFGQLTREAYSALSSRRAETVTQGYGHYRYLGNVGKIGGPAEDLWNLAEAGAAGFTSRRWTWLDRARSCRCLCNLSMELNDAHRHTDDCERGTYVQNIAREAERMSDAQFRQLFGAEWLDWNDLPVYSDFDRSVHITDDVKLQRGLPLDVACDFNVDPMCWTIGQHLGDEAWAFDEIVIPGGAKTRGACRELIRRYPDKKIHVHVYGDASGTARKTSASHTDYEIIREELGAHYLSIELRVPASNPAVTDRVNAFNAMLRSATGAVRWHCHSRCTTLAKDLARVSWKPGTRDIDKTTNRTLSHASDAEGYRLVWAFPCTAAQTVEVGFDAATPIMGDSIHRMAF